MEICMKVIKLRDAVEVKTESINPLTQPAVAFNLYSLPGFDENKRVEHLLGREIHSNKYLVPNHCILLNKLNVRFRRIWRILNESSNKLCSTEFIPLIVKNGISLDFIYYSLLTDAFTNRLTNVHTNTSGSHSRVDLNFILDATVYLPPLSEQLRIAGIMA